MEVTASDAEGSHAQSTGPHNVNSGAGHQTNYTTTGTNVRQYNGPTTVHEAAQEKVIQPLNTVPFPRDEAFVHRAELDTLTKKLSEDGKRVAVAGFGGIGKTQLAIEYCYQLKQRSPDIWILWIHASSAERFDQGFQALAADLQIPGIEEKDVDIHQLVRNWLLDTGKRWLVVLDNVDVADFLYEKSSSRSTRLRIEYIPTNGSVVITSRRLKVAVKLVGQQNTIELHPNEDHAIALLQERLGQEIDKQTLARLATALEFVPLAISQAAAYISNRAPRSSPDQYLTKLKEDEQSMLDLLNVESEELRRDGLEAKNSILQTWQISFEYIYAARRSAADLLSLMSFFHYQGIPEMLVRGNIDTSESEQLVDDNIVTKKPDKTKKTPKMMETIKEMLKRKKRHKRQSAVPAEETSDTLGQETADTFEEDIMTLRDYAFITISPDQLGFEMHRLVQLAAQIWLKKTKQYERWKGQSLRRLDALFPLPDYELWPECRLLYPHTKLLLDKEVKIRGYSLGLASILYKSAVYAWDQGSFVDAEIAAQQSLVIREMLLTDADERTLDSLDVLAVTLQNQGRLEEAVKLFERGLNAGEMALGAEHWSTLRSMCNLAPAYRLQGRLAEAEALQVEVLDIMKRVLGVEDPDTLKSMYGLALTYDDQDRLTEAQALQVEVLEISKRVLGIEHPDTLKSMDHLALTYNEQGRFAEAETLEVEVLEISKRVLGAEHRETLTSMHNLAVIYFDQREFKRARELMSVCLEARIRRSGASHPDTRNSVLWLEDIKEAIDELEVVEVITTTKNLETASDDQSATDEVTS